MVKNISGFATRFIGNFSLVLVFLVSIFYPHSLYGIQTLSYATSSSTLLSASFTFSPSALDSRNNIFPDRVYFNASGAEMVFSAGTSPAPFPAWQSTYPYQTWNPILVSSSTAGVNYIGGVQAAQFPADFANIARRSQFIVSNMAFIGNREIFSYVYPGLNDILKNPFLSKIPVTGTTVLNPARPHALTITRTRAYIFWIDSGGNLKTASSNDASSWTDEGTFAGSGIVSTFGPCSCLLKSGSDEYVAVAFPTSATSIKIITFKDGTLPAFDSTTLAGIPDIEGSALSLGQNPRDSSVHLCWLDGSKIYHQSGVFDPLSAGKFTFAASTSIDDSKTFTSMSGNFGFSCGGGSNFETSFVLPAAAGMYNYFLKNGSLEQGELLTPAGFPTQFYFTDNGNFYAGLIVLSSFSRFDFFTRRLEFPDRCSWQNPDKILHLEGPPQTGSQIRIEVDHAEPHPELSLTRTINAGTVGGFRDLAGGYRVIASSSTNYFALNFDKPMRLASYPLLIGINTPVRLLDSLDQTIAITHIASTSNELIFRPDIDLQYNATYRISIASSVIDNNGSQIYTNATITFTTQTSSSQVVADEINSIGAFTSAAFAAAGVGGEIASGSEVNASATVYLRVNCVDPAFNTIDTIAVDVVLDDSATPLTSLTLTETAANSGAFTGAYTLSAPTGGLHSFKFKTAKSAVYHPVFVSFPSLTPNSPASAAINVPVNSTITVTVDESLDPTPVNTSNIVVSVDGTAITTTPVYNDTLKQITITPAALLASEKLHTVSLANMKDLAGNPQIKPLIYNFTIEDKTAPVLNTVSPVDLSGGILINSYLTLDFSENIAGGSVDKNSVKLFRNGTAASYSLSISGAKITIDPDDSPEGFMQTEATYRIEVTGDVTDQPGNAFNPIPSPFASTFTTMASQTAPSAISTIKLFSDAAFSNQLTAGADYPATGTLYIEFAGNDGQNLTRDSTVASISTGVNVILTETASSTGIFRGSVSFSGLADRFNLKIQSTVSPATSEYLQITWPALTPAAPASAAIDVPVNSSLKITADEALDPAKVNSTNIVLSFDGTPVSATVSYDNALRQITITPAGLLPSEKTGIVSVNNQTDIYGNPQTVSLIYSFKVEDKTAPVINTINPTNLSNGVLINSLLNIDFSENIAAASVDKNSVKLFKNGVNASFSLSVSGNRITIDPDDIEGYLLPETSYRIEVNSGVTDLPGNAFNPTPAPYTSTFTTMASQTIPTAIDTVRLFSDAGFTSQLSAGGDYYATGTLYIEFSGTDGQSLTRDSTIASISTGLAVILTETASSTGIFRGSTSFSGLSDRFDLKVQSMVSPAASAALLITWPTLLPAAPASAAINVSVTSALKISADETLDPAKVNSGNVILSVDGAPVSTTLSYDNALKQITITPDALLPSEKTCLVSVRNQTDIFGNPQTWPLIYSFKIEDKTAPVLNAVNPADLSNGVLINRLLNIDFSENIAAASVDKNSVKLFKNGSTASYSLSVSGNRITVDPDDIEGYMLPETTYRIEVNNGVTDLPGNAFNPTPAPFTSTFITMASQTVPANIDTVRLFSDAGFTSLLAGGDDYYATGTLYIEFFGTDGQSLTRDSTVASISTGQIAILTETASASGIFRGSTSFAGLSDRFALKVQSAINPAASAGLIITWPGLLPGIPASGAINVPLNSTITILADEPLSASEVNNTNIALTLDGADVATALSYNNLLRQVTITPSALLASEKTYVVRANNQKDLLGNPQNKPLVYSFTIEDKTPPTITAFYPVAATMVTIDQRPFITFSEAIAAASIDKTSIKLLRNGSTASYSLTLTGNRLLIDPDDGADHGMTTSSTYRIEINNGVRDLAGNTLLNVPEPFQTTFFTQPHTTPPGDILNLSIYKDPLLLTSWNKNEKVPASATIYVKAVGSDGATQTRDLATVTLALSWGQSYEFSLQETASDSTGYYLGLYKLSEIPLFGIPTPQPPVSAGQMTFFTPQKPEMAATLSVTFPELLPEQTTVTTLSGKAPAAGVNACRIDSSIILTFSDSLLNPGDASSVLISSGTTAVPFTRILSTDRKQLTLVPDSPLPFSSNITVTGIYSETGLRSLQGNPLYRPFNFTFSTQPAQSPPLAINSLRLYPDAGMSLLNAYVTGQDFNATGVLYIEAAGLDGAGNTIDTTAAVLSTGVTVSLIETTANSGIYRGSVAYANLPDGFTMNAASSFNPSASETLKLSFPALSPTIPASGSTNVSFATQVSIRADEAIELATVNNTSIKLMNGGSEISGTVTLMPDRKTINFAPAQPLDFSKTYTCIVAGITDLAGNPPITPLIFNFSVQANAIQTVSISSIKAFSDADYTNQINDGTMVAPETAIYIEIAATDLSASTVDTTDAVLSTSASGNTITRSLIETTPSSGVFRGVITAFADENATLTFFSKTDSTKKVTIKTFKLPRYLTFQPASGSSNLYLDTIFTIETGKNLNFSSVSTTSIILTGNSGLASYTVSHSAADRITLTTELSPSDTCFLKLNGIKDIDGLEFPGTILKYSTLTPALNELGLFADQAFTTPLGPDSEVEFGRTVYIRLKAINTRLLTPETATCTYSDGLASMTLNLVEGNAGEFTASFVVPDSPGNTLTVTPEGRPDLAARLKIIAAFSLLSFAPASGAVNIPADTWPSWDFNREIDSDDLNTANFSLLRIKDSSIVPVNIRKSMTGKQVRLEIAGALPLLEEFEMRLAAGVRDTSGNILGKALVTRFTTQPPPPPPTKIVSLKNYETAAYATETFAVANNDSLYLELVAQDTSFSTYETARVRIESSDPSLDGRELVLIEVSPPSGIYRLTLPINVPVGTSMKIISQASPDRTISITAQQRTLLTGISPASGSSWLFLDQPITMNFSSSIDRGTTAAGIIMRTSQNELIGTSLQFADSDRTVILAPIASYAAAMRHRVEISTSLRDINGLFLLPQVAEYDVRGEASASFVLLTGISPRDRQRVNITGEAVRGQISIIASTTDMMLSTEENRLLRFSDGSRTIETRLSETSSGHFEGIADLSTLTGENAVASLIFADQPALNFNLASVPQLLSVSPASGSSGIAEFPEFAAGFSRKIAYESGAGALTVITPYATSPADQTGTATDATLLSWSNKTALPVQASCSLTISGLYDYLGQPVAQYRQAFSTGGLQGINVYSDNGFAQLIATSEISVSQLFVEVAASDTRNLNGQTFFLAARRGTRATETIDLQIEPSSTKSGLFRCSLSILEGKGLPRHSIGLYPGEWLELTSPQLTDASRLFYFRHSQSTSPRMIKDLRLYSEKDYAQEVTGILNGQTLYIELEAEDLNWLTRDFTSVQVSSDADPKGFTLNLAESGTHSSQFRNFIKISHNSSDAGGQTLKVLPGQRFEIVSLTDPSIRASARYQPENGLRLISAYPSPARGNSITFRFYLNFAADVHLEIFDTAGDEIKGFIIRGQAGENLLTWKFPAHLANGAYFYLMEIGKESSYASGKRKYRGKFAVLR